MITLLKNKTEKQSSTTRETKVRKHGLVPKGNNSYVPYFLFGILGLTLFNTLLIVALFGAVASVEEKSKRRLVEDSSGNIKSVVALDSSIPSDSTIQAFVNTTLFNLHNWRGVLPPEKDADIGQTRPDPGVSISDDNKNKVPYMVWRTGFSLEAGFRQEYLKKLSTIVPKGVFASPPTAIGIPEVREVGIPQKISPREWKVTYHGYLGLFNNSNLQRTIPLKYNVFVRRIDAYIPCPRMTKDECEANMDDTQRAIYEQQKNQLIITHIKEMQ